MKLIFSFLIFLFVSFEIKSQDVIHLRDFDYFACNIISVDSQCIKYTKYGNNIVFEIDKNLVKKIEYKDGRIENFNKIKIIFDKNCIECLRGKEDANNYHNRVFGNLMAGFWFGVIGVGIVAASPTKPPNKDKIEHKELYHNRIFLKCYSRRAKGINVTSAVLGEVLWVGVLLVILNSVK
ncbi:MAG: hypothetical protein WC223_00205 [Bacteroidales bacterium]